MYIGIHQEYDYDETTITFSIPRTIKELILLEITDPKGWRIMHMEDGKEIEYLQICTNCLAINSDNKYNKYYETDDITKTEGWSGETMIVCNKCFKKETMLFDHQVWVYHYHINRSANKLVNIAKNQDRFEDFTYDELLTATNKALALVKRD